ncbi:MAG: addiction module toxin RelE [Candidatus Micrarchaeota archaeon]
MSFSKAYSEGMKATLQALARKDRQLWLEVFKKMNQIAYSDEITIDHYKNMKYGLADYKRVHVGKSFVLFFKVLKEEKMIFFDRLMHHDDAYRR